MIWDKSRRVPYTYGQTIYLRPLFDIHLGHALCDKVQFKRDLAACDLENTYFIGGGDLLDSIIVKDIKRYEKAMDGTEKQSNAIVDEQIEAMYDILKPYASNILGLGDGNHEHEITKRCATNPVKRLCAMLSTGDNKVPYLSYDWFYTLTLSDKKGGRGRNIIIYGMHGYGGGSRTQGGSLTKYAGNVRSFMCDIALYGHDHQCKSDEMTRLGLAGKTLIQKPVHICLCGTYQKTLSHTDSPSWAETKGFPPVKIGGLTVSIKPDRVWADIKVSK